MAGTQPVGFQRNYPGVVTMFGIGPMEMVIVGIIALLLFGKRLPEVAKGLGKSIVEFKKGMGGVEDRSTGNSAT